VAGPKKHEDWVVLVAERGGALFGAFSCCLDARRIGGRLQKGQSLVWVQMTVR
jgi:hypothetical protein